MLQAVKDWHRLTGQSRSVKAAGGIRTTKDAMKYLVMVHEIAGPEWLHPDYFRFGASGVVNDLVMQRRTQKEGHYSGPNYVTVD
jgi:deoxyribose-phosphate aldolase